MVQDIFLFIFYFDIISDLEKSFKNDIKNLNHNEISLQSY